MPERNKKQQSGRSDRINEYGHYWASKRVAAIAVWQDIETEPQESQK